MSTLICNVAFVVRSGILGPGSWLRVDARVIGGPARGSGLGTRVIGGLVRGSGLGTRVIGGLTCGSGRKGYCWTWLVAQVG